MFKFYEVDQCAKYRKLIFEGVDKSDVDYALLWNNAINSIYAGIQIIGNILSDAKGEAGNSIIKRAYYFHKRKKYLKNLKYIINDAIQEMEKDN